jgi:hypothetical protein
LSCVLYRGGTRLGKRVKNTPYSNLFVVHGLLAPEGKLADDTKSFVTEYNKEHPPATMDQLMKT